MQVSTLAFLAVLVACLVAACGALIDTNQTLLYGSTVQHKSQAVAKLPITLRLYKDTPPNRQLTWEVPITTTDGGGFAFDIPNEQKQECHPCICELAVRDQIHPISFTERLIEVRLELDELPTKVEYTVDYIRSLPREEFLLYGIPATLVCVIGSIIFWIYRRMKAPKIEHWDNMDGVMKKVAVRQSKVLGKPNVIETTTRFNCIN